MVQIAGKYSFVSQDNFDEYLKAADIGVLKRSIIAATKPDITIVVDGDHYTVTTHTTIKDVTIAFTLGQQYEADPGTDKKAKYITTLEGGDTLVTKDVDDATAVVTRKFTDDGLLMTMSVKGVTSTRTFKRA